MKRKGAPTAEQLSVFEELGPVEPLLHEPAPDTMRQIVSSGARPLLDVARRWRGDAACRHQPDGALIARGAGSVYAAISRTSSLPSLAGCGAAWKRSRRGCGPANERFGFAFNRPTRRARHARSGAAWCAAHGVEAWDAPAQRGADRRGLRGQRPVLRAGGDGTFLTRARDRRLRRPDLGVNLGRVGFWPRSRPMAREALDKVARSDYQIEDRFRIAATVFVSMARAEHACSTRCGGARHQGADDPG